MKDWQRTAAKLGPALKSCRNELGWTLHEAAQEIGLHFTNIARFETGERLPGLSVLEKIAMGYGTTVCAILRKAGIK